MPLHKLAAVVNGLAAKKDSKPSQMVEECYNEDQDDDEDAFFDCVDDKTGIEILNANKR